METNGVATRVTGAGVVPTPAGDTAGLAIVQQGVLLTSQGRGTGPAGEVVGVPGLALCLDIVTPLNGLVTPTTGEHTQVEGVALATEHCT